MTNFTKQLNLLFRLTGFILSAVFLCFLAKGICFLYRVYHTTMRETHSYADISPKTAIEALDHQLAQVETATKSMTQESAFITSDPQSAYTMQQKRLNRCSYIFAATLMFRDITKYETSHGATVFKINSHKSADGIIAACLNPYKASHTMCSKATTPI